MAGKHRKEKIVHSPTKRQLSKWARQKKMSRIITICVAAVVVATAILIAGGYYVDQVMPFQKTVIKVNNVSYDLDYYIEFLDAVTRGTSKDMVQYYPDVVSTAIQQGEVISEKASEIGITVTDDEVNDALKQGGLDNNNASFDLARLRVITKKYADQQCLPKQPQSVQQAEVQAILLETKTQVMDRKQKLLLGDNFTAMAAQFSIEPVTRSKNGYLGWVPKGYESYALSDLSNTVLKDVIFTLEPKTWSDPVYDSNIEKSYGYWVVELLEKDDAKGLHGRGILFSNREQAEAGRERLLKGESWTDLAKEYSQAPSKDTGGDLGWILPGSENAGMIVRILGAQEPNTISDIIRDDNSKTKGGYWLVQVLNLQDRPLPDNIKQALMQQCMDEWVQGLMKDAKTEVLLDETQKNLAIEKVTRKRSQ